MFTESLIEMRHNYWHWIDWMDTMNIKNQIGADKSSLRKQANRFCFLWKNTRKYK